MISASMLDPMVCVPVVPIACKTYP